MSGYGSLFERLAGEAAGRSEYDREVSVTTSVASHLSKMLSTRAGSVQMLPDYGLPDLNDMRLSLHDALAQAREAIRRFIETYEPRLGSVQVVSQPQGGDPLTLTFAIEGWLEVEGIRCAVSFTAHLDGSGKVKVR
ncbi:type VI secretion system baseplate subunit TssE [Pseudomonas sp. BN607]|uniref:type VI secretion system baseplate subunit TssE n=1 Tax=Pseudomonas sp. BN607 TaxID=2567895 RepID=UPI002456883E|nr:type VI secretion system baseplate subunit TssE [Pseudomonas sp. BN607]MDH4552583.1 type VI secretion system baseplate subunit TssE [Pseudomonas sp. BN607]